MNLTQTRGGVPVILNDINDSRCVTSLNDILSEVCDKKPLVHTINVVN